MTLNKKLILKIITISVCLIFDYILSDNLYSLEIKQLPDFHTNYKKNIVCMFPLSGKYEALGKSALRGVIVATDVFQPGYSLRIILKDFGESAREIENVINQFNHGSDISLMIGPVPSVFAKEISGTIYSSKIPTLVFPVSEQSFEGGPYIIKFFYSVEDQAEMLARYAVQEIDVKSFGVLYPDTQIGELFKDAFVSSVKSVGGIVNYIGSYDSRLRDVSTEIKWIKAIHPEAVFIPDGASRSAELIMKLKMDSNLSDILFLGPSTWNSNAFLKTAGKEFDGVVHRVIFTDFFFAGSPDWIDFSNKYRNYFNEDPGYFEFQVYKAINLILPALKLQDMKWEFLFDELLNFSSEQQYIITKQGNESLKITPKPLILTVKDRRVMKIK